MKKTLIRLLGIGLLASTLSCSMFKTAIILNTKFEHKPEIKNSFIKAQKIKYAWDYKKYGKDYWQTPKKTKKEQEGDCEDKAIFLWDLLRKQGIKSQVIFGWVYKSDIKNGSGHAWVEYEKENSTYILDPTLFIIRRRRNLGFSNFIPSFHLNFIDQYNEFKKRSKIKGMINHYDNLEPKDLFDMRNLLY